MSLAEVGRLTPFQVREIYCVERDKKTGSPLLDPPLGEDEAEEEELTLAGEFRKHWLRQGITDPDALTLLVERSLAEDEANIARMTAAGAFEDDQD